MMKLRTRTSCSTGPVCDRPDCPGGAHRCPVGQFGWKFVSWQGGVAKFVTLAHGSLFTVFCILECCCRDSFGVFFCGHLTRHLTLTDAVGSRMRTRTRMFVLWKFSIVRVRVQSLSSLVSIRLRFRQVLFRLQTVALTNHNYQITRFYQWLMLYRLVARLD